MASTNEDVPKLEAEAEEEAVEIMLPDIEVGMDDGSAKRGASIDEKMPVETSSKFGNTSFWTRLSNSPLPRYQQLVADQEVLKKSLLVLKFGIFADALNSTILQPNYAIMVQPEADPDSFSSTTPFDFSTATYAIPMFALLGIAISGMYSGRLSDRVGRKPILLASMFGSAIGSIAKYLLRGSFWGFNMANLANGLVSGSLPVALAYVGDVFRTDAEKATEFGMIVAFYVVGQSGGGIIAILMASTGLFAPLWVGAAMMFLAGTLMLLYLVEPGDVKVITTDNLLGDEGEEEEEEEAPTEIDRCCLNNVIFGALLDNIGSAGLFPLCLSPLAFERFYQDFIDIKQEPLLSLNGYKWVTVLVAFVVVPTAMATPRLYEKIGAAGACVLGNVMTAIVTALLLILGTVPDATSGVMAAFIVVIYVGFPTTVFSQLSTSPMLDAISPHHQRGYVQGLNSTVMNVGTAFAPWILGIIADNSGTTTAICCGMGVSVLAAAVNFPLTRRAAFGPATRKETPAYRALAGEDKDVVEKALRGSFVSQNVLRDINRRREKEGESYLALKVRPYEEDKQNMEALRREALKAFRFQKKDFNESLVGLAQHSPEEVAAICERANNALGVDPQIEAEIYKDLGQWFADYVKDNGYFAYTNPLLMKTMIMSAFPTVTEDKELSPENLEEILLNLNYIYGQYIRIKDDRKYTRTSVLGTGSTRTLYG